MPRPGGLPAHALCVHFPVALLSVVPLLDGLALLTDGSRAAFWAGAAWWALAAGLAAGAVAAVSGLPELLALPPGAGAARAALWHVAGVGTALALDLLSLLLRTAPLDLADGSRQGLALGTAVAALVALAVGGHHGARLVYVFGAARASPEAQEAPP